MFPFLVLAILGIQFEWANLHLFAADWSSNFHKLCLTWSPESEWRELYQATVCGKNLREPTYLAYLKKFGLLHVIVVSGSHLLFLERVLHILGLRAKKFVYPIMIFFSLVTLLQPPVTRALIGIFISDLNLRFRLFWHPVQITFMAGIVSWLFFPQWIHSFSFLLSWSCSLILCLVSETSQWKKQILIFVLMSFFLLPLQTPHPLSVVLNLGLAPLVGLCLFPASLVAFMLPQATFVVDPLWNGFYQLLRFLDQYIGEASFHHPLSLLILWAFLWSLHLGWEFSRRFR